jgi:hypothetical protein
MSNKNLLLNTESGEPNPVIENIQPSQEGAISLKELRLRNEIDNNKQRITLDKIARLSYLLTDLTIDDTKTTIGSEPFYKHTYDGIAEIVIKSKIIELIDKL